MKRCIVERLNFTR